MKFAPLRLGCGTCPCAELAISRNDIKPGLLTRANSSAPPADLVYLQAPPKVGSVSLLALKVRLSRRPVAVRWNCRNNCSGVVKGSFLAALLVREPLNRLVSGILEILSMHCDAWMGWRLAHQGFGAAALRPQPAAWRCKHANEGTESSLANLPQMARDGNLSRVVAVYMQDMQTGHRDTHTHILHISNDPPR